MYLLLLSIEQKQTQDNKCFSNCINLKITIIYFLFAVPTLVGTINIPFRNSILLAKDVTFPRVASATCSIVFNLWPKHFSLIRHNAAHSHNTCSSVSISRSQFRHLELDICMNFSKWARRGPCPVSSAIVPLIFNEIFSRYSIGKQWSLINPLLPHFSTFSPWRYRGATWVEKPIRKQNPGLLMSSTAHQPHWVPTTNKIQKKSGKKMLN